MDFNAGNAKKLLEQFEFAKLFVEELGWDRHNAGLSVAISGATFGLKAVAEKRGMVAWVCQVPAGQQIPDRATRKKIETQVAKTTLEHLVIFIDAKRAEQIWCWARREAGKPASVPEHFWYASSGNRGFLQKLQAIAFSLAEESTLTLVDVTARARAAFDVERVTKRFYDQFKAEHKAFLDFISGITDVADREWYASLMLNRLMFIYFMQRKGFLNGERDYLRDRLARCQRENGQDKFYSFYRYFLLRLFHEGLGGKERNPELDKLLGRIPYLNGGLFEKHTIEERCPDIKIPDEAFTRIFAYFDRYQWHLDERPLRNDNEINPDVLGYIFEKYINQKQMGAYYTKEDITEYISKNTVIPFLFDAAKAKCKVAFENPGGPTIWDHLCDDPDRYIYTAVKHGAEHPLPSEIAAGISDVSARTQWNRTASGEFGLPTEIWREVVARRARYTEIRAKLAAGEVREINDLITLNLDIRQFAQDVIERCEGPDLLRAFWKAIEGVTVLDPTCGSGAFLFAALNILEPLYETCLDRMEAFVADLERSSEGHTPKRFEDFKTTLAKVGAHPNARYFALKSIILNNLYGVDIMEEAVEICKLRLFLKLAAQVDPDQKHENLGIEPLPDIDFNIRAGNTLVGYATYADVKKALTSKLDLDNSLETITKSAADLQQTFNAFRARQIEGDGSVPAEDKLALRQRLKNLEAELNRHLAAGYGVSATNGAIYAKWLKSHEPFHWFIEFHGIMHSGGFDVIVGNPPYLELREVDYRPQEFKSLDGNAIHAMCIERSLQLMKPTGAMSMIVPLSLTSTQRMRCIQDMLESSRNAWYANFAWRPAKLFDAVNRALTIFIVTPSNAGSTSSTSYQKWTSENRDGLVQRMSYVDVPRKRKFFWVPKLGHDIERSVLDKIISINTKISHFVSRSDNWIYYRTTGGLYWKVFTDFAPAFNVNGIPGSSSRETHFSVARHEHIKPMIGILSSSLFWWWYTISSNLRDLNPADIQSFPVPLSALDSPEVRKAGEKYLRELNQNSNMLVREQKSTGRTETQSFKIQKCKQTIDEIDRLIGPFYGINDAELDFIVSYDLKFRLGSDSEVSEE
ncbi:MAG: Eco57I restriction-modification methylase domain-containing protein [Rhodospirillales bacterium]|nr:Eco57I restriction-modification methylase domain-containing protein [Rhodospirillales bacterium]